MITQVKQESLARTGIAYPSQWEAETVNGQAVYIRYWWGCLSFRVGDTLREALLSGRKVAIKHGRIDDNYMEDREMKALLSDHVEFVEKRE